MCTVKRTYPLGSVSLYFFAMSDAIAVLKFRTNPLLLGFAPAAEQLEICIVETFAGIRSGCAAVVPAPATKPRRTVHVVDGAEAGVRDRCPDVRRLRGLVCGRVMSGVDKSSFNLGECGEALAMAPCNSQDKGVFGPPKDPSPKRARTVVRLSFTLSQLPALQSRHIACCYRRA
jgi:hypothetical protein